MQTTWRNFQCDCLFFKLPTLFCSGSATWSSQLGPDTWHGTLLTKNLTDAHPTPVQLCKHMQKCVWGKWPSTPQNNSSSLLPTPCWTVLQLLQLRLVQSVCANWHHLRHHRKIIICVMHGWHAPQIWHPFWVSSQGEVTALVSNSRHQDLGVQPPYSLPLSTGGPTSVKLSGKLKLLSPKYIVCTLTCHAPSLPWGLT